jgi:zinc protease
VRDENIGDGLPPAGATIVAPSETEVPVNGLCRFLTVAVLLGAGAGTWVRADAPRDSGQSAPAFPFPVQRTQLDNGLTVMSVAYDSPGVIAYYTVVRTGSRNEVEPGLSGFAHFFEHMMFRGTPRFSEQKYNQALKALGADSNAFTTDDWTCYHITASAAALETIVDLESDRFQNLKYDEAGFQKEARAVLGEYNKSASSPMLLLDEKMQDTAYTTHTYKHTTIGFLQDIKDMPNQYEYSLKFFDRWYRPENCIVLVVGDVAHDKLVSLTRKYYGNWKRGNTQIDIPQEPPQTAEKKLDLKWKGQTLPMLYIGYHAPGFDARSREIAALDLLAEAMFSETSPLYRKLVLQERKVQQLMAGAYFHRDPTLFTIMVRLTDQKHIDAVRAECYRTLDEAARTPIAADRLADVKSHLRYQFAMQLDTPDAVARTLGEYLQLSGEPRSVNDMYATYDATTAEDIRAAARKFLVPTNRTAITLTVEEPAGKAAGGGPARVRLPDVARALLPVAELAGSPVTDATGKKAGATEPFAPLASHSRDSGVCRAADESADLRSAAAPQAVASTVLLNPKSPLVALRVAFRVGSKDDPRGKEGLAALTARLIAEGGSTRFSYDQILEKLYPMAGRIDGNSDKELSLFTGDVHRDKLTDFYGLFAEMILSPRFDPEDFERLREEQLNYVSKLLRGNDDENLGKWTMQLALFDRHPYGHVDAGTVAGLKAITLEDVKQFYRRHYTAARVQLGVAGGADDEFVTRLKTDFGKLPSGGPASASELPKPHTPRDLEITIVSKDCIATAISIGFPLGLTRADDDFYALAVANSALGEHRTFNGRLMQNMRGKRGLNYGDYSYIENFIQHGGSTFPIPNVPRRQQHFSIWIRPVPHDKAVFALRQAVRELDRMVEKGLSEEDFESTRNFLLNYSKLWVQTASRRLGYEMDGAFYGRASLVTELDRRLPKLTCAEVNAAVRRHLQSRNLAVAMVTRDAESLRQAILSGEPSPLVYDTQGTPQEILDEDKLIEKYPLRVNRDRIRIVPVERMFEGGNGP